MNTSIKKWTEISGHYDIMADQASEVIRCEIMHDKDQSLGYLFNLFHDIKMNPVHQIV